LVGVGELLRHLSDLFDRDAEHVYAGMGIAVDYRARYTPIMRALESGPLSITGLQQRVRITQGAISQTVKLMEVDGLLRRVRSDDQRVRKVALTRKGERLRRRLSAEWDLHLAAIAELEDEIGVPLRKNLTQAITALEQESYYQRIENIRDHLMEE